MKLRNIINDNKKAQFAGAGLIITIFALVGIVAAVIWVFNIMGNQGSELSVTPSGDVVTASGAVVSELTFTEDVTVSFSSFDMFSIGTDAGVAHRILSLDGTVNIIVADDATLEKSPGNEYVVLLGNSTDAADFTAGTTYYPTLVQGTLPDDGTFTIGENKPGTANHGGQVKSGGAGQLTFTFFDENGDTNVRQALATDDERTVEFKIRANNNLCVGNIDTGGLNALSYQYNTSIYTDVVQLSESKVDQSTIETPTSVSSIAGKKEKTYTFPIVCDNQEVRRSVRLEVGGVNDPNEDNNINITISDTTWYVDDDTLEVIAGYEDEDDNDLGVTDFVVGNILVK